MAERDDLLIFSLREKKKQEEKNAEAQKPAKFMPQQPQPQQQAKPVQEGRSYDSLKKPQRETIDRIKKNEKETYGEVFAPSAEAARAESALGIISEKKTKKTKAERQSREAASGLYCAWHPWRDAYAICAECHRPFCYEDIAEYGGKYYCLEDIDTVAVSSRASSGFNRVGFLAAGAFLIPIIVYILFVSGELTYIFNYIIQGGITNFLYTINITYAETLLGFLFTILLFLSSIMIFVQSRKGYSLGMLSGFLSVALFVYEYISSFALYSLIISVLSFIGLVTLSYSISSYAPLPEPERMGLSERSPIDWPALGKF